MSDVQWHRRCGAAGDCVEVGWRKSTYSADTANCVEVWRKSSRSLDNGTCVEVAAPGPVLLRDSKDPDGGQLTVTRAAWAAFVAGLRGGDYNREGRS
jgi:hypothetical protein